MMISKLFDVLLLILLVCGLIYMIPRALEEWGWTFKRHDESGDTVQPKHYCVNIVQLSSKTTTSDLKRWFKGPGFLGAQVVANVLSGDCFGQGLVYFDDKNAAKAAIKELSKSGLYGTLVEVDKPWPGFRRLSEMEDFGHYTVDCYGVGSSNFGQFCFKCGLSGHYASKCRILIANI